MELTKGHLTFPPPGPSVNKDRGAIAQHTILLDSFFYIGFQ